MVDEKQFYPGFVEGLTALELVVLQHDLRRSLADKPYLDQVLQEFKRRDELAAVLAPTPRRRSEV